MVGGFIAFPSLPWIMWPNSFVWISNLAYSRIPNMWLVATRGGTLILKRISISHNGIIFVTDIFKDRLVIIHAINVQSQSATFNYSAMVNSLRLVLDRYPTLGSHLDSFVNDPTLDLEYYPSLTLKRISDQLDRSKRLLSYYPEPGIWPGVSAQVRNNIIERITSIDPNCSGLQIEQLIMRVFDDFWNDLFAFDICTFNLPEIYASANVESDRVLIPFSVLIPEDEIISFFAKKALNKAMVSAIKDDSKIGWLPIFQVETSHTLPLSHRWNTPDRTWPTHPPFFRNLHEKIIDNWANHALLCRISHKIIEESQAAQFSSMLPDSLFYYETKGHPFLDTLAG